MYKNLDHKICIIGDGQLAKHFKYYFQIIKIHFNSWSLESLVEVDNLLRESDIILLMISDDAIESFYKKYLSILKDKIVFHFSGALSIEGINSCHPLMTFSKNLYSKDFYSQILLVGESGKLQLSDLIDIPNPTVEIPSHLKGRYHALCVMAGNFTTILWQEFFKSMENDFSILMELTFPYLEQIKQNLVSDASSALTGPLARRDIMTINKNLNSIPMHMEGIYKAFVDLKGIDLRATDESGY